MTRTYEQLIPRAEREKLELALEMGQGYVLDLSDRTFNDFFHERLGIDPETEGRLFNGRGTSKAKRLRSFIERAPASLIAKLLRELWNYRSSIATRATTPADQVLEASYFITVGRFEGVSQDIDSSVIESFEPSETLDELVASIRRDLDAKKPHAALDRLHTYCMKRFASLVRKHGGGEWRVALPTARTCRRIAKTEPAHNSVLPSSTRSRLACSRSNLPKSVMMLTRTLPVQPKVNRPDIPMIGPSRRHRSGRVTLPSPRVV